MARIFISYDREDSDFAELVDGRLTKAGHDTRMDAGILDAGEDWRDVLDQAVRESDALVVIMTPEARVSDYVTYEWAFALGAGVRVIPVALKDTAFHPRLDVLQRLDFTNKQRPWEVLLQEVDKAVQARRVTTVSVPADAPPTVKSAVIALDSLDVAEQVTAVKALAATDHPAAREALIAALGHPMKSVRMAAALEFPDSLDARIVPGLICACHDEGFRRERYPGRYDFGSWITHIGPPAIPNLIEALQDRDAEVRCFAINVLGQIGENRTVDDVIVMLRDAAGDVRCAAARALGRMGDGAAVQPLIAVLGDENENLRAQAATALGSIGGKHAAGDLLGALKDKASAVRAAAAEALGLIGETSAGDQLLQCLGSDSSAVRIASAVALGRIGEKRALPVLLDAFQNTQENYFVRRAVARGLGLLGDATAEDALRAYLTERRGQERWLVDDLDLDVAHALVALRCTGSFWLVGETLNHFSSGRPPGHTVELLGACGGSAVATLAGLLDHRSAVLRDAAVKALRNSGNPEALTALDKWERSR